jgi:hypothetical protein
VGMQSHDPDDWYIILCRMLRRFIWLRLRPLRSVAGLAYMRLHETGRRPVSCTLAQAGRCRSIMVG